MQSKFLDKIDKFIKENNMLCPKDKVIVGVSGGADSVALLLVLLYFRDKYDLLLKVVHIHHGLRKEADEEAEYVERLCRDKKIDFFCKRYDCAAESRKRGLGLEETGRILRYEAFCEQAGNTGKIAIAHNLNDRAETMLFHLCRGTGPRGLAAIRAVSQNRIRPLLCVTREEIEDFLAKENVKFYTDASNNESVYTRNRIRNNVLPLLNSEVNSEATSHIATASLLLEQQNDFIQEVAKDKLLEIADSMEEKHICIKKSDFEVLHPTLQREIIKQIIDKLVTNNKDITLVHIQSVIELLQKGVNKKVDLPYNLEVFIGYNDISFDIKSDKKEHKNTYIELNEGEYCISGFGKFKVKIFTRNEDFVLCQKEYTKYFDYDKINSRLVLRNRLNGDYITVNSNMGTKKLKDYFIDIKMDSKKRDETFLLADESHILWVIGHRISEYYKITEKTKKIVSVEIILED